MAENVLDKIIKKKIERIKNLKDSIKLDSLKDLIDKNDNFLNFKEKIENNIDNKKLSNYELGSFRNKVGFISQEIYFFNDTLRNNLDWFSNKKNTNEEIYRVLKLTGSYNFVNNLPNKLDTIIGDKGLKLSGGQRQRLSFARALLRKPKILILDEATSSLDAISDKVINNTIKKISMKEDITILIISHKTSSMSIIDRLILIDDKKIKVLNKKKNEPINKNIEYKKFTKTLN